MRLTSTGARDKAFGERGIVAIPGEFQAEAAMAYLSDGRIIVGGSDFLLARFAERPAAGVGDNGTLIVTTEDAPDSVTIRSENDKLRLSVNGLVTRYPLNGVNSADLRTAGGSDSISITTPLPSRIDGGSGKNRIVTSDARDIIDTGGGSDVIDGGGGRDLIRSRGGNDTVFGGTGNDQIFGGAGDDHIFGGTGNDNLYGEDGADSVYGERGRDNLHASAGSDLLAGGREDDIFWGGFDLDPDTIDGGLGTDLIIQIVSGTRVSIEAEL